jgi:Lrp/AsnC family transcriptional regulator, leucine-responsive regulatory protein
MVTSTDLLIMNHLRRNARIKITDIARNIGIPPTTIYDRLRAQEKRGLVKKHVTLIDFSQLGYQSVALLALHANKENRQALQDYLIKHPNVNSLYRTEYGADFLIEVVIENAAKLQDFIDQTDNLFGIKNLTMFNLSCELKKEGFLSGGGK